MKSLYFLLLVFAVGSSLTIEDNKSLENNDSRSISEENSSKDEEKSNSGPKMMEKSFFIRQQKPKYFITPDQKLVLKPFSPQYVNDVYGGSYLGLPTNENRKQNIYLSDDTGKYSVRLQNFQRENPSNFNAALGAISAHILNQKKSQEYIPFPPNGDPNNYPSYRGHLYATEPPVVRAYERATNSNYGVQPVDFNQQNPRRYFPTNDHQPGFTNQFQDLGYNPTYYNDGEFFSQLRRNSGSVYEPNWYDRQGEYRHFVN